MAPHFIVEADGGLEVEGECGVGGGGGAEGGKEKGEEDGGKSSE